MYLKNDCLLHSLVDHPMSFGGVDLSGIVLGNASYAVKEHRQSPYSCVVKIHGH